MAKDNKTITTKYGTKINVSGLTPEQVARVRSMAEDKGAYGAKGAALADQLRKRNTKIPTTGAETPGEEAATDFGINDINKKGSVFESPELIWDQAPKIPGAEDLQGDINKVRDANYSYITKDYASAKAQEMEEKKQELAERGIPLDPSPTSLYGRTLAEIDKKYQGLDDQARNQAIIGGDSSFQTQVGAAATANDAFMNAVFGLSDRELAKYGIDQDTKIKLKQIAAQLKMNRGGGGGGGGGGGTPDTSPIIGGNAPGFNV